MPEQTTSRIRKITADDPLARSADVVADNIAALKSMFPDLVTEGTNGASVNTDVLKQLVGDQSVTDTEEKFGLNWHGKRRSRQLALTPSTGTLRPCPEESVDWDNTQNLFIEGDNLEVLKLLQKSYAGMVKLIYIDPPYNTGRDFIYPDDFRDSIKNYQMLTGQTDSDGRRLTSNSATSGRFHTDWLSMMYPRLRLARTLLSDDGLICISVDDAELDNLRRLCGELFGDENFIVQIIWRKRSTPPNDKIIGANHDYIVCYARNADRLTLNLRARSDEQIARYKNPDNHPKGPWAPGDLMANVKGGRFVKSLNFPIVNPKTGEEHFPGTNGNWRFSRETIAELIANDEISFGDDGKGKPKLKRFLCDVKEGVTYPSIWDFVPLNTSGSNEMQELFGDATIFESPKPVGLLLELLRLGTASDSLVLDFFAGSGTLGHAIMQLNAEDGGSRRYVVVQLPEPTPVDSVARKSGFQTISALSKERLRRASKAIPTSVTSPHQDRGFRAFSLAPSSIREWEPSATDLAVTLADHVAHIRGDRAEADLLYELLLKRGLDLCVPIDEKTIAGKTVHSIGAGSLIACLDNQITRDNGESLALGIATWHNEISPAGEAAVIFRDDAFADDVVKTNVAAILEQHGLKNVRSL